MPRRTAYLLGTLLVLGCTAPQGFEPANRRLQQFALESSPETWTQTELHIPFGVEQSTLAFVPSLETRTGQGPTTALRYEGEFVVLDSANQRIARFAPDGSYVGQIDVPAMTRDIGATASGLWTYAPASLKATLLDRQGGVLDTVRLSPAASTAVAVQCLDGEFGLLTRFQQHGLLGTDGSFRPTDGVPGFDHSKRVIHVEKGEAGTKIHLLEIRGAIVEGGRSTTHELVASNLPCTSARLWGTTQGGSSVLQCEALVDDGSTVEHHFYEWTPPFSPNLLFRTVPDGDFPPYRPVQVTEDGFTLMIPGVDGVTLVDFRCGRDS
mgnify:CR=1 FL=1